MLIEEILRRIGPCLTSDLAKELIEHYKLTPETARQRVSRGSKQICKLQGITFGRRIRFCYLKEQFASYLYWERLYGAIYATNNAYSYALGAISLREIVPLYLTHAICGSPNAQKKHIPASSVIEHLITAKVLISMNIPGIGMCVMTKPFYEKNLLEEETLRIKARLATEEQLLQCAKEWLRNLAMVSYNKVKTRTCDDMPRVGTFSWDLTAPSYLSGLTSWSSGGVKPGFFVCDVVLKPVTSTNQINAFINKVRSIRALKGITGVMFMFIAEEYDKDSFAKLRSEGVIPATPRSLFGNHIAKGINLFSHLLSAAYKGRLEPENILELAEKMNEMQDVLGDMKGAFFEYFVAEVVRKKTNGIEVEVNQKLSTSKGDCEIDVMCLKRTGIAMAIECKARKTVPDLDIDTWLDNRIPRFRSYLKETKWKGERPVFELWTIGRITEKSRLRIENTKKANERVFDIRVLSASDIAGIIAELNDKDLDTYFFKFFLK